jgi:MFS family permease
VRNAAEPAVRWLFTAAFLRSAGVGLCGVLLGVYLATAGLRPAGSGLVVAAGRGGTALATLWVSLRADRAGRRWSFVLLAAAGGIGVLIFALTPPLAGPLAVVAALGMVNGLGRDRGPLYSLDHAVLLQGIPAAARTRRLAWYHITLEIGNALGCLAAAMPAWLQGRPGISREGNFDV